MFKFVSFSVWPNDGLKSSPNDSKNDPKSSPNVSKNDPKRSHNSFYIRLRFFQKAQNVLIILATFVTKNNKNRPFLSHWSFWQNFIRYIAVCYPIVHRDLVHTYSVAKRVMAYTIPVLILSLLINIPKFLETKVITRQEHEQVEDNVQDSDLTSSSNESSLSADKTWANITVYSIDVTELRSVFLFSIVSSNFYSIFWWIQK